jgi:DNA-binding NarL/FixJ family response regulator
MVNDAIRVVLADDHPRVRARIHEALIHGEIEVVGEAATADEAVRLSLELKPDVTLLDIHMPGNGIAAARRISAGRPGTAIVMLTQSDDDDDLFDSLRAGASGYLLKGMDPAVLPRMLRGVLAGEAAMPPRLVARVLDDFRGAQHRFGRRSAAASRLSAREWEIMELLGDGRSTDEVAKALFVSPTTVRVHVSSVLRKLQVKDRESAFSVLRKR